MSLSEHVQKFVELCEQGRTLQAMDAYYAEDVVVYENHERARTGRDECRAYEERALQQVRQSSLKARARAVEARDGVAFIEWLIRFVGDDGRPMRLEEVAVQRWAGGRIIEERFYYAGVIDEGDEDAET
ncbi:MAG: nuclear transport factor 2 family protein [Myxococcales bacterium]